MLKKIKMINRAIGNLYFKICLFLCINCPFEICYLIPIPYLVSAGIANPGIGLGFGGLSLAILAQLQMGDSWRLGINSNEKTNLITNGLFRYSRNPVYLGLMISYFGFFFFFLNVLSLCFLVLSYVALEVKIRLEENYLESVHIDTFNAYKRRVRRWI